ncbi:MAG: alpha/beta fold hydrolase [bacterium]|nr:alpha/beta fold hydrolase [bacterium]
MVQQATHWRPQKIAIEAESQSCAFFLVHGYTGSPTDFNGLPEFLHAEYGVSVLVPLLPGHGTIVEDLEGISCENLLAAVEKEFKDVLTRYKRVIVGGHSFGGQVALYLAALYPVAGVFVTATPYTLRFPLSIPGMYHMVRLKKIWEKKLPKSEKLARAEAFYYTQMPSYGLELLVEMNKKLSLSLSRVTSPLLSIFTIRDKIAHVKSARNIEHKVNSHKIKNITLEHSGHGVFHEDDYYATYNSIGEFFLSSKCETHTQNIMTGIKATAIVPSYNERMRIGDVLSALIRARMISEVIVVDDGSTDGTEEYIAKTFPSVVYLRNEKNCGKAFSMDRGVKQARENIIFFCDADLRGLIPEHIDAMVTPVSDGRYDMNIGIRSNIMQKLFLPFALNSGERALKKDVWHNLPGFYKKGFRIEAGLNYFVYFHSINGVGYKIFPYFQTLKEKKYGFLEGSVRRWKMNVDVVAAWLYAITDLGINTARNLINGLHKRQNKVE